SAQPWSVRFQPWFFLLWGEIYLIAANVRVLSYMTELSGVTGLLGPDRYLHLLKPPQVAIQHPEFEVTKSGRSMPALYAACVSQGTSQSQNSVLRSQRAEPYGLARETEFHSTRSQTEFGNQKQRALAHEYRLH